MASSDKLTVGQKSGFGAKSFKIIQGFDWKTDTIENT